MKKSVGLVVMVMVPQEDGSEVMMAVLQRRGTFNTEKMKPESYPGCCQVTCHGGLEEGEDFDLGLVNELSEELGHEFSQNYSHGYHGQRVSEVRTAEKEVITFGALMPIDSLKVIRLGPDSGGIMLVGEVDFNGINGPITICDSMKKVGAPPSIIAMFPDEITAVKNAFVALRKMTETEIQRMRNLVLE